MLFCPFSIISVVGSRCSSRSSVPRLTRVNAEAGTEQGLTRSLHADLKIPQSFSPCTLSTHKFSILWLREYVFNQGFSLRYHGAIRSAEGAGGAPPGHGRTNGLRKERYTQRLKGKRVGAAGRALTREGGLQTSGPAPTAGRPRQPTQPPAASFRATTVVDGHTTSSGGWRWTDPVCARHAWRLC